MGRANIEQWDQAASAFTKEQEQSVFSDMNKAIVKARFPKLSGEKVLDLGCGYGYYTDYFQSIGGEVIGIYTAKEVIRAFLNAQFCGEEEFRIRLKKLDELEADLLAEHPET